ncbi:Spy0128 family protein [Gemmiger sp.]
MSFAKTALRCWLTAAVLLLALCCPLPVFAARAGAVLPVTVRTDGTTRKAAYVVSITPQDGAPASAQSGLTIQSGGTAYFTGFDFDAPGDYRYTVTQTRGTDKYTTYDSRSYTVIFRVTGRTDGGLDTEVWAVHSGETAKADAVVFVNRYDPPTAVTTTAATVTGTPPRTVKSAAAPAARTLPQTGDTFPVEALAAMLCAGVVGFGTAWKRR